MKKSCKKNLCYSVNYRELENLSYGISVALCKLADSKVNNIVYSYKCVDGLEQRFVKLKRYQGVLDRFRLSLLKGAKTCLCESEFQSLKEKILDLVKLPKGCRLDCIVEDLGVDGRKCISQEPYERLKYYVCDPISFDITVEQDNCDVNYSVGVITEKECKIQWETCIKETKCNITYDVFVKAIECGMTYDFIVNSLNCGATINYNIETDSCELSFLNKITNK